MKRIIALTLALLMSFSCFSLISFAEETDTVEHLTEVPEGYVGVYTKDDLYAVRENPSGKYILMNDIVFEDEDYVKGGDFYNSGAGWEPIGTDSTPFKGVFDGNNYTIYNLYINSPDEDYQGLFGYIYNATIQKTNVLNAIISAKNYAGGIVGYSSSHLASIINCDFYGTVIGSENIGGIIGYALNTKIINCKTKGKAEGTTNVGGL
ncbi:MAG: hypothetical protein II356_07615, partial [Clostridia bacterium]|nr:hypothetical protein [Clostridia bacterium]